uniref:DEP domain-containing protein 7-like n=1 Tax=Myxine glutinosa TaxID=7769 RepID=UPI00358F1B45
MARSVKAMAAKLDEVFSPLTSTYVGHANAPQPGHCPFKATRAWRDLVQALRTVHLRRHRVHFRSYKHCFTGMDAVDTILAQLMHAAYFSNCELSRLKAVMLCQALLERGEMEILSTGRRFGLFGDKRPAVFEDSERSLYRFPQTVTSQDHTGSQKTFPVFAEDHSQDAVSDVRHLRGSLPGKRKKAKRSETTVLISTVIGAAEKTVEEIFQHLNLKPLLYTSYSSAPLRHISDADVEQVWRQQTLLCLLQLVDLQVIDPVLISSPRARSTCHGSLRGSLAISNEAQRLLDHNLSLECSDNWLAAALDCLEWLPNSQLVELAQQLPIKRLQLNTEEVKPLLFDALARHYEQVKEPLLSSRLYDIHAAVLQLLGKGQSDQALEASQLWLRLLESHVREELRAILRFMAEASSPDACRLQKKMDNRLAVCRVFGKAIIQNKVYSATEVDTFLNFLIDNHAYLFKVPAMLQNMVSSQLSSMQHGGDQDSRTDLTYCQQVNQRAFEQQQKEATVAELSGLLKTITNDPDLPLEKKRHLAKEYEKHHPSVVVQHMSSVI